MPEKNKKLRILAFIDYYLPGFKGGGSPRTLVHMVEHLSDECEFYIVTRDRDINDDKPYATVRVDEWNTVGAARVFYASPLIKSIGKIFGILRGVPHDVLYLNSFFSLRFTAVPLALRRLGVHRNRPVIIAPRGEFSPDALAITRLKKRFYIQISKAIGLYDDIVWQASSTREAEHIRTSLGSRVASNIQVVPDLLPKAADMVADSELQIRAAEPLQMIFLSRISPMKNTSFLLKALKNVKRPVQLNLYGPREDEVYWKECQRLINEMPSHVRVEYCGEVRPENVLATFARHHLFIFPTRGENFGHVIFESLAVGTPVIISDQTPWSADQEGSVQVLSLEPQQWTSAIESWTEINEDIYLQRRRAALAYARSYRANTAPVEQNRALFRTAKKSFERQR